jgi:hypothetical protein
LACKRLALFLLIPAVYQLARGRRALAVVTVIILAGAGSATGGIVQYAVMGYDNLARRPHGFVGHYMNTAAGPSRLEAEESVVAGRQRHHDDVGPFPERRHAGEAARVAR